MESEKQGENIIHHLKDDRWLSVKETLQSANYEFPKPSMYKNLNKLELPQQRTENATPKLEGSSEQHIQNE